MKNILVLFLMSLFLYACPTEKSDNNDIDQLTTWMTGEFSSKAQAAQDSSFYDINLVMYPIWEEDKKANWLYVEQAVSAGLDRPYRQRIYKITRVVDGTYESRVYEFSDPGKYVHAWKTPALFSAISPDSLKVREGCAVFLQKASKDAFKGSTNENACKSTLYGASYATSEVEVYADRILSWDRGWDSSDKQVWGAEKSGYIFIRKKATP